VARLLLWQRQVVAVSEQRRKMPRRKRRYRVVCARLLLTYVRPGAATASMPRDRLLEDNGVTQSDAVGGHSLATGEDRRETVQCLRIIPADPQMVGARLNIGQVE